MPIPPLPEVFGRYRVLKLLGSGAMGAVYLADDTQLERQVALKVPTFDGNADSESLARFYREARTAATLRHPHICPVYDVGAIDGRHYISMAYLDGQPLSDIIKTSGPQSERFALGLIRKLALALQEAHNQGIVHRDLKPANVMIDGKRNPIIMDFGLACQVRNKDARMTQQGVVMGSPAYMAPEQLEGDLDKITAAVDQYGLGTILFEILSGQLPFRGSVSAVISQIATKPTPALSSVCKEINPRVEALCLRMMAKSAEERFPSMKAVAEEVARILAAAPKNAEKAAASESIKPTRATETIVTERDRWATEQPRLLALAKELHRKHDYAEARKVLAKIPAGVRTPEAEQLLADAADKDDECCLLLSDIEQALQQQTPTDPRPLLKRFLQLKPGHKSMQQLMRDIDQHGVEKAFKIRRRQDQSTDPAGRTVEPLHIALVVGGLFALCAAVYFAASAYEAPRGKVILQIADPKIAVTFASKKVTAAESGQEFLLKPEEKQELQVEVHGVLIHEASRTISVAKNETKTITARLEPDGALKIDIAETRQTFTVADAVKKSTRLEPVAVSDSGPPWKKLFDGQSFSGWQAPEAWKITGGVMEAHPDRLKGNTPLQTESKYEDFEMRFQYRLLNEGALSLIMRFDRDKSGWNMGPQLNLGYLNRKEQGNKNVTGGLFALVDLKPTDLVIVADEQRKQLEPAVKRGNWIDVTVRCEGTRIIADVNGLRTVDYIDANQQLPLSGRIAFYIPEYQKAQAEVRNIQIRTFEKQLAAITPATTSPPVMTPPTTPEKPARRFLFVDEYDKPQSYWSSTSAEQLKENPNHQWGYRDGTYFDEVKAQQWYFGYVPGGPYPECTWELSSRVAGDNSNSRGSLVLHLVQSGRGIQIRIDGMGLLWIAPSSVTFDQHSAGPWVGPISHRAIRPGGGGYNKIRLDIRKRRLDVIINDVAVVGPLEFAWDLTPVSLGMGVDCQSPSVRAEHDRIEIGELREPVKPEDGKSPDSIKILANGVAVLPDGTHCYEGVGLKLAGVTGGGTNPQWDLQTFQGTWTNDCQLIWWGAKVGNVLTVDLPIEADGLYQIVPGFTVGPDFGRFKIALDGKPLYGDKPVDLFDPRVQPATPISLGTLPLTPGNKKLTFTVLGKNRGSTGFVFALDELRLIPVR